VKPAIGRIVHYVSYGTPGGEYKSECRAAVVTEVTGDPRESAGLCVLNPAGQFFSQAVPHDEGDPHRGGTWHWPEREDDPPQVQVHPAADLPPEQIRRIVEQVQASLLAQARRSRRPGPS
jgi:hypothetical protein